MPGAGVSISERDRSLEAQRLRKRATLPPEPLILFTGNNGSWSPWGLPILFNITSIAVATTEG